MTEFRGYLKRLNVRPDLRDLPDADRDEVLARFEPGAGEVVINGEPVSWRSVDAVEVVKAAHMAGPAGLLVRTLYGEDRYHVGVYYGSQEAVITNISLKAAQYIVQAIAYYASDPVRYNGIEGLSPIAFTD